MGEALPTLPGPALEGVLLAVVHQWIADGHQGRDLRRFTLPLVCKAWKRALVGAPRAWDEVGRRRSGWVNAGCLTMSHFAQEYIND